jgi:hypothetical protein
MMTDFKRESGDWLTDFVKTTEWGGPYSSLFLGRY